MIISIKQFVIPSYVLEGYLYKEYNSYTYVSDLFTSWCSYCHLFSLYLNIFKNTFLCFLICLHNKYCIHKCMLYLCVWTHKYIIFKYIFVYIQSNVYQLYFKWWYTYILFTFSFYMCLFVIIIIVVVVFSQLLTNR